MTKDEMITALAGVIGVDRSTADYAFRHVFIPFIAAWLDEKDPLEGGNSIADLLREEMA